MSLGIIASVPNEGAKFVPLPEDLASFDKEGALDKVIDAICSAFGWGDEADPRVLFKDRDLDDADDSIPVFLKALSLGQPPFVRVLFRLLGGKGGFGALLRKQGRGKKTTNFEASRDLSGRRLRHSKAVDRIKEWMETKKREEDLVKALTGEGPELPKPVSEHESLDPAFVERLKRTSAAQAGLVRAGLKKLGSEAAAAPAEGSGEKKRARVASGGDNWLGGLDALSMLSSPSPSSEPEADDDGGAGGASASAAAASSESETEERDEPAAASSASAAAGSASAASGSASAASGSASAAAGSASASAAAASSAAAAAPESDTEERD